MHAKTSSTPLVRRGRTFANSRAGLLLSVVLLAACGGVEEDPAVSTSTTSDALRRGRPSGNRPPEVPADFVATPHGYFHPSCVQELGDDERVGEDGAVERPGGERRALAACRHPRYDRSGRMLGHGTSASSAPPPTVSGWVGSISSTSIGAVRSISAEWYVPQSPAVAAGQTLYFFPGLEPASTGDTILQPVLAWNGFNDGRWSIASWNCCKDGNALHSTPRIVATGDRIIGKVTGSGCNAAGVCSSWTVGTSTSLGVSTTLWTTSYGEVLDWEFGGAFEAYGVGGCNQYPADGGIAFTSLAVRRTSGEVTTPSWSPWMGAGLSPSCLTSASVDPGGATVRLAWTAQ